jgi:iron complex outermembrane receptor protein
LPKQQNITWFVAGQLNNRKEFDVRRSQRSDIPALSLQQLQLSSNLNYTKRFQKYWQLKLGVQTILTDNTNNPETGILPLIPDYRQLKNGLYIQSMLTLKNHQLSAGARYDTEYHYAPTISEDVPRQIITYERNFHNATTILNYTNRRFKNQLIGISSGFAMRNPAINELYSFGLHQGVSGLEEGNINLKTEKSIKSSVEYSWTPSSIFEFSGLMYYQYFKDYIYLNPADEFRLTIRGAFPAFTYEQSNANLLGFDLSSKLILFKSLSTEVKYSFLRGNDLSQNIPLVYMPPNSLNATLALTSKKTRKVFERVLMDKAQIALKHRYVFKQNNLLENQDFAPVPEAYYLMSMNLSAQFIFPKVKLTAFVRGENMLNSNYRDYLNRLRYFSDDQGLSIVAGANLKF